MLPRQRPAMSYASSPTVMESVAFSGRQCRMLEQARCI